MPKEIRCAQCGLVLKQRMIAIKKEMKTVCVVEPHNCIEVAAQSDEALKNVNEFIAQEDVDLPEGAMPPGELKELDVPELNFDFINATEKSNAEVEIPVMKDNRSKKYRREELSTTAPQSLINAIHSQELHEQTEDPRGRDDMEGDDYDGGEEMEG